MKRFLPFLIIVGVLAIAIGGGLFLWKRSGAATVNPNSTFATSATNPTLNGPAQAGSQPLANESAGDTRPNMKVSSPVVLEEYGDYQCPPCGQLYPDLKQIEKEFGSKVKIVFHHFPLIKIHKNALAAARAAEAARNQNKFWQMHDKLYGNQKEWSELEDPRPVFVSYARQLNLNIDQFINDLASNLIDQRISSDIQRGAAIGVTGTPTVFLDSHLVNYQATNAEGLRRGINILLGQKGSS